MKKVILGLLSVLAVLSLTGWKKENVKLDLTKISSELDTLTIDEISIQSVMYEEMGANNEHSMSCYTSSYVKKDEWSTWTFDLKWEEVWNKNFNPKKKVIGIQLWTNATKTAYIKDVELLK